MGWTLIATDALGRIASVFRIAIFSGVMQNPRELQWRAEPLDRSEPSGYSTFVSPCCACERAWPLPRHGRDLHRCISLRERMPSAADTRAGSLTLQALSVLKLHRARAHPLLHGAK